MVLNCAERPDFVKTSAHSHLNPVYEKLQYSNQIGRSMIEMLGVLAIIGVLSIGGISGFSKAMYKNKLNKQADQYSHIIAGVWEHDKGLMGNSKVSSDTNVTPTFYAIEIIPKEMGINNDTSYFYDVFGNKAYILQGATTQYYVIMADIKNKAFDQCKNIIEIAKGYHEYVAQVYSVAKGSSSSNRIFGDKFCTENRKRNALCLQNMTIKQMEQICSLCKVATDQSCTLRIHLSSAIKDNNTTYFDE